MRGNLFANVFFLRGGKLACTFWLMGEINHQDKGDSYCSFFIIQDMFQDNPLNEPFMHEFMSDPAYFSNRKNGFSVR